MSSMGHSGISYHGSASGCQKFTNVYLIANSLLSAFGTILIFVFDVLVKQTNFKLTESVEIIKISLIIKCIAMVPFITFEYYLILFEHLFVDTSHYMSG